MITLVLLIGLLATNIAWLIFLHKLLDRENLKEADLLNRINVLVNKPAFPTSERQKFKAGYKSDQEKQPRRITDAMFDPEMEAVGKIDPSFIDRARSVKNG